MLITLAEEFDAETELANAWDVLDAAREFGQTLGQRAAVTPEAAESPDEHLENIST